MEDYVHSLVREGLCFGKHTVFCAKAFPSPARADGGNKESHALASTQCFARKLFLALQKPMGGTRSLLQTKVLFFKGNKPK
eukprot:scaffold109882_cov15-Tisochrysis_lutea.AAC.1